MWAVLGVLVVVALAIGTASCWAFAPRTGFVTLQFDDSHQYDYSHIFPYLEQYGLKGTFGYIVENSDLGTWHDSQKMVEIHNAGHEIQDHTTLHDYMWATQVDTLNDGVTEWLSLPIATPQQWDSLCHRSRQIMNSLGITANGWNQPGGGFTFGQIPGHPGWASHNDTCYVLYDLISTHYTYMVGSGVPANTAHLNLRGHNCPDRFPLFNVPHTTIDDRDLPTVKTEIADAVASGLWYTALFHSSTLDHVAKAGSLIQWLAEKGVEVLTCRDGVERVTCGRPDRWENQFPQAAMLSDLDGNGKPDGFTRDCLWDTTSATPAEGVNCIKIPWNGVTEFYCYGPEVGTNGFSVWIKSAVATTCVARVRCVKLDFDWQMLGDTWTQVSCGSQWVRIDSLYSPNFSIDVADEVDRLWFQIIADRPGGMLVAYPELLAVPDPTSGVPGPGDASGATGRPIASPNPVRMGAPIRVATAGHQGAIAVYDIQGRRLSTAPIDPSQPFATIDTSRFSPGVLFVVDTSRPRAASKVVVIP